MNRAPKRSWREKLQEPGTRPAAALVGCFFLGVFAFLAGPVLLFAVMRGWSTAEMVRAMVQTFLAVLLLWGLIAGVPYLFSQDDSWFERVVLSVFRRRAPLLEVDDAPARLARKRGRSAEAASLYLDLARMHPDHLYLRFHAAEIQHHDLDDRDGARRGYRDFLRRMEALNRAPRPEESKARPLAEAYLEDLERPPEPPPEQRRIKV